LDLSVNVVSKPYQAREALLGAAVRVRHHSCDEAGSQKAVGSLNFVLKSALIGEAPSFKKIKAKLLKRALGMSSVKRRRREGQNGLAFAGSRRGLT